MKKLLTVLLIGAMTFSAHAFQQNMASNEAKGAKLKGKILDANNKEMAVAGSNVTIAGTELGGASMPNGLYMITNIPAGTWKVKVNHPQYLAQEKTITATDEEMVELDFELEKKTQDGMYTAQEMKQDPRDTNVYFVAVENLPEPIGGMAAITENIVYPEIIRRAGIEGTAFIEAFIDERGNVVRTAVVKSAGHPALDSSASKAVTMTKFKPGKQRGKPVRVRLAIPIRFKIMKPKEASGDKVDRLRIRVIAKSPYEGVYYFDGEKSRLKTIKKETDFEISEESDYVSAIFHSLSNEEITVELYTTSKGHEGLAVSGTGRILIFSTTGHEDGRKGYGVQVTRWPAGRQR